MAGQIAFEESLFFGVISDIYKVYQINERSPFDHASRTQLPLKDRKARSRLIKLLAAARPLAHASLVTMAPPLRQKRLQMRRQGEKHVSLYLGRAHRQNAQDALCSLRVGPGGAPPGPQNDKRCWGYEVVLAVDAYEAQHILVSAEAPRLAILNCLMPGLDGPDLRELTRVRKQRYVYTILLSAAGHQSDVLKGFQLGADDYLCKPFGEMRTQSPDQGWRTNHS